MKDIVFLLILGIIACKTVIPVQDIYYNGEYDPTPESTDPTPEPTDPTPESTDPTPEPTESPNPGSTAEKNNFSKALLGLLFLILI